MKLGSFNASPLDGLREQILPQLREGGTEADVRWSQPMDFESGSSFWEDLRKGVNSRRQIFGSAHSKRMERELNERFGIFKGAALHPCV
mmetsp:Transcript_28872/g.89252  ORF Transcript_28872/g.89252 Transcript_28872/m.89252 type:complete len:89 (-) Transcript_28872:488-754(-)